MNSFIEKKIKQKSFRRWVLISIPLTVIATFLLGQIVSMILRLRDPFITLTKLEEIQALCLYASIPISSLILLFPTIWRLNELSLSRLTFLSFLIPFVGPIIWLLICAGSESMIQKLQIQWSSIKLHISLCPRWRIAAVAGTASAVLQYLIAISGPSTALLLMTMFPALPFMSGGLFNGFSIGVLGYLILFLFWITIHSVIYRLFILIIDRIISKRNKS